MNTPRDRAGGLPGGGHAGADHWFRLSVSQIQQLTADAVAVTLHVPTSLAAVFAFRAGQHVTVRHRGWEQQKLYRTYSVCPPPSEPDALRLVVARASPGGFGSYALTSLTVGEQLELSRPTGQFGLSPAAHHVLIAGGTGIAAMAVMASAALRDGFACRVSVIHAVRSSADALLADELAEIKNAHMDRFTAVYVLSQERRASALTGGRLDQNMLLALLKGLDTRQDTAFRVCGPRGLLDVTRTALAAFGACPDKIRSETFSGLDVPQALATHSTDDPDRQFRAVIGGHSSLVSMLPHDEVCLDALLRDRPEVPYACRNGVCGSCRAKVVAGSASLNSQQALSIADIAAGYTLACRAVPRAAGLTLDFDA
ncbi:2Fe-2S iron-sulfur cluster-binding protein [Streptomyces sp. NPDC015139]|uniref:2Fe-2S iron-sulfur cluster-binding protein n=1 Tax=Streptomyces sp. NPDC015139 TaxID=3364942 RepID=UPI0036FEEFA5